LFFKQNIIETYLKLALDVVVNIEERREGERKEENKNKHLQ
jgi:hypothetical protein